MRMFLLLRKGGLSQDPLSKIRRTREAKPRSAVAVPSEISHAEALHSSRSVFHAEGTKAAISGDGEETAGSGYSL
jgi:hypothetical protein